MNSWIPRGAALLLMGLPFAAAPSSQPQHSAISHGRGNQRRNRGHRAKARHRAAGSAVLGGGGHHEDIKQSGATNIVEVARNVPGLYITDLGPGQSQVAIRGISAGQVVRDQPGVKESVGIYLDESPISVALFTPDLDLYDLDRIEVLRGPQGTLFGAGSARAPCATSPRSPRSAISVARRKLGSTA